MGKRELIALLNLSSWCLVMVERLFLAVPQGCLQFVIVVFPDHIHLLFLYVLQKWKKHVPCFMAIDSSPVINGRHAGHLDIQATSSELGALLRRRPNKPSMKS